MERRYLVAALAIIATFTGFSRGFQSLQHLSPLQVSHLRAFARVKCEASAAAAHAMARVRTHLHPGYPEEAQLLAEMNAPMPPLEEKIALPVAPAAPPVPCVGATVEREAQRAHRDSMRMRQHMARLASGSGVDPISLRLNLPSDFEQRIQAKADAMTARMEAQQERMQIAAARMQESYARMAESVPVEVDVVDQPDMRVDTHISCKIATHWQQQTQQAVRRAMQQMQYGFTSK
jgi:hypothetical protein